MVVVRLATDNDRTIVSDISKHYDSNLIRLVYNTWQQQGWLYVAEQQGKSIGFCCLNFPATTEAQILGVRLVPEFRKEGIGQQFVIALIQTAQERGCNIVRILTSTENWETQAALQRNLYFQRRGTWYIGYQEKIRGKLGSMARLEPASPSQLNEIWQFLQYSQIYRRSEGLIFSNSYSFRSFSKVYLAQLLEQGRVYASLEGGMVAGVACAYLDGDTLVLSYLDARSPVVSDLLQDIINTFRGKAQYLISAIPADCYGEVKPFLAAIVENHAPDSWLVMEKEVSPLALPRE